MLTITNDNNYLLQIVKLESSIKHPNADRLQIWNVNGYEVITDMSRKPGDICILFPIECKVNANILSKLNLFSDKTLNENQEVSGYVHSSGRIRATKLRGVVSEGMLLLADSVLGECKSEFSSALSRFPEWRDYVGTKFDTFEGKVISEKYVPVGNILGSGNPNKSKTKTKKKDILVEGQFRFHYDTSKLQDNAWRFDDPNHEIVITDKWHGTSAIFANLLTKNNLSFYQKIKRFFGSNIPSTSYRKMYASRSVLKHIETVYDSKLTGFYSQDVWRAVFDDIFAKLFPGYTLYGEIVGYVPDSTKMIQKGYDYGCKPGEYKFIVYRITETDRNGKVKEYLWSEVKDFCIEHGLSHAIELYNGLLGDLIDMENQDILEELKKIYLEKNCECCKTKVPAEGICIRNESVYPYTAYKLKSKAFLLGETASLDEAQETFE